MAQMATWDKKSAEERMECMLNMTKVIEKLATVATDNSLEGYHKGNKSRFDKLAHDEPNALLSSPSHPSPSDDVRNTADSNATN